MDGVKRALNEKGMNVEQEILGSDQVKRGRETSVNYEVALLTLETVVDTTLAQGPICETDLMSCFRQGALFSSLGAK